MSGWSPSYGSPDMAARRRYDLDPGRLIAARKRLGLTQQQFARRFRCAIVTLQRWEQGRALTNATGWLITLAEISVKEKKHGRAARQDDPTDVENGVQPS